MQTRRFTALAGALMGSAAFTPVTTFAAAPSLPTCSQLATLLSSNTYISQTASDNQGKVSPTATIVPATATNAAYCNVHFQFSAQSGPTYGFATGEAQTIGINVGLPLNTTDGGTPSNPAGATWPSVNGAWNGKIENIGGGGNQGTLSATTQATNGGYVGSNTDTGHNSAQNGTEGNFGVIQATNQLDVGKINDFIFEGIHQQYVWAKWLGQKYYGQPATRNYWYGCSTGGRQGMELAGAYGYDFDGFVAGAPATYWQEFFNAYAWDELVNRDYVVGAGDTAITSSQYNAAVASAVTTCDVQGTDTVADGVVDDPRQCTFDATANICGKPGAPAAPNCLDPIQAAAIDMMWDGPRNHDGRRIWHSWQRTTSGGFITPGPAERTGQLSPQQSVGWDHKDLTFSAENLYSTRAMAAANPLGEPHPIALEDEFVLADSAGGPENLMRSANFQGIISNVHNGAKHGKIITWQGGADNLIFTQDSIEFYREVATLAGGGTTDFNGLQSWWRYYHAPGVGHCGAGVGANPVGALKDGQAQIFDDLVNWVENGVVPQSAGDSTHMGILATGPGTFGTRPICPWPTTAIYTGSGSTAVASNYTCGGNLDANVSVQCQGLHTVYGEESSNSLDYKEQGLTAAQCPNP